MIHRFDFWLVTVLLGLGTFVIRLSFLGFLGGRQLRQWLLLHLRYVGVAVFPALVTPMVIWPEATQGTLDPARVIAFALTFVVGYRFGVVWSIVAGLGAFYILQYMLS